MSSVQFPVAAPRHSFYSEDARLNQIHDKVMANERLDEGDALALYRTTDMLALGSS